MIGGGIAGLVAAHTLARESGGVRVVLCEASDRLGGIVRTDSVEGVPVEAGPDSFLTRDPVMAELCGELGLAGDLIAPAVFGGMVWLGDRLVELPAGFVLGMPASARAALTARALSPAGRVRAALERWLPGPRVSADTSVGKLVRRRFGKQVLERVVDPLLAGTRAGRVDEISVEAALPSVWSAVQGRRSVTRGLGRTSVSPGPPPFMTVRGGLDRIVGALRDSLGNVEIRTGTAVQSIAIEGHGFRLATATGEIHCDAVIAATPAYESARLLRGARPAAATALGTIEHASVATIVLSYPPGAGSPPEGTSGLLVPSTEGRTMSACTWYSTKWPDARPADGGLVLRCFVGRAGANPAIELDDDDLIARVAAEAGAALGLTQPHRGALVTRWRRALPQYEVGHRRLVDDIERLLADQPGIWVTGGSYRGSGLPDCVRHARQTAGAVLARVAP